MAGATQVTININLSGFTFPNSTFTVGLEINNTAPFLIVNMNRLTSKTARGVLVNDFSPGNKTFTVFTANSNISPTPTINNQTVGFFTITFNDNPPTISPSTALTEKLINNFILGNVTLSLHCVHGNSLISTQNGLIRIDQLQIGDKVLSGNNLDEYATIKSIAQCWIQYPGPDHDAIIFEPGSLGPNEPSKRLIIDPGHPMCLKSAFLKERYKSLKPAADYIHQNTNENIYVRKWIDPLIQEDISVRYDLILEEPYSFYIANDIVIMSHGYYDHRYKHLI